MNGPYPIYEPDDENSQNFPMPGDNPVPQPVACPDCGGTGEEYELIDGQIAYAMTCPTCDGHGVVWP